MRLHPQIKPYIVRPTRETVQLVVQLAPVDGDPTPPLRIDLDRHSGIHLLDGLMDALRYVWLAEKDETYR